MAGSKNNTITYNFEGNTVNLEEAIDRLAKRFKKLHKESKEATWNSYTFEGSTKSLYDAYAQIGKSLRGVRRMLKEGQGQLTQQDKDDLKTLRTLRKEIQQDLANADTLDAKGIEALQKRIKAALRVAHRLRKRAAEAESKYQLKEQRKKAKVEASLSPESQAAAGLNIENFERLKGFANLEDPAEKAFIEEMESKVASYKNALKELNAEKERQASLSEITKEDEDRMTEATNRLATATYELNNAYKNGINDLRKMAKLRNEKEGGHSVLKDFGKKLYSQSLRRLASSIISMIIQGVKEAFSGIADIFEPFNKAMSEITSAIKYLFNSLATAIAPIVQMLAPALTYLTKVVARVAEILAKLFSAMAGNDVFVKAKDQVDDYAESVNQLKNTSGLDELNKVDNKENRFMLVDIEGMDNLKSIGGLLDSILGLVTAITEPLMTLLESVLRPICDLLATVMSVLQPILDAVAWLVGGILQGVVILLTPILNWLHTMVSNLPLLLTLVGSLITLWILWKTVNGTLITSLFTLATHFALIKKRIIDALVAVKKWIVESIKNAAQNIKTAVSTWIAEKAYWKLALAIIAAAGMLAAVVAGIVLTATAAAAAGTASYQGSNPATAALATGGIVAAPTLALVGEGKYPEAVVPLGQSPQFQSMKEGIASEVVGMLGSNRSSSNNNRPIILQMNGRELARALLPDLGVAYPQMGVKLR